MRRLIRGRKQPNERGVAAVIVALGVVSLLAAAGLGIDTGNLAYQRSRLQHSADTGAVAIAFDCVLNTPQCTNAAPGAPQTADGFATQNSSGANPATIIPSSGLSQGSGQVEVQLVKNVPTKFFNAFGITSKNVHAKAKATWTGHPREGASLLPFAMPYCSFALNPPTSPPSASPHIRLRTDATRALNEFVDIGADTDAVMPGISNGVQSCTVPAVDSSPAVATKMLFGPIPLSAYSPKGGASAHWDSSFCRLNLADYDQGFADTSNQLASGCLNKVSKILEDLTAAGKATILVPVYAPASHPLYLGMLMSPNSCDSPTNCVIQSKPIVDVKILGFAAFKVTGWNFKNGDPDDSAAPCPKVEFNSASKNTKKTTVNCEGIQGYFVTDMHKDNDFTYGDGGIDFKTYDVHLSE